MDTSKTELPAAGITVITMTSTTTTTTATATASPAPRKHTPSTSVTYSAFPTPPGPSSRPNSIQSRQRRHTHSASDTSNHSMGRSKSSNHLLAKYSAGLEDTFLTEVEDKHRESSITALADFLKNQTPPPSNYMSTPDDMQDEKQRGRWAKWKTIGRRSSSAPRSAQRIVLPDSAVSGVTVGGHRHIAISIPLTASPFGHSEIMQYTTRLPAFGTNDGKMLNGKTNPPVRTYMNEKGVVTVLRTVNEDESKSAARNLAHTKPGTEGIPKRRSKTRLSAESGKSKSTSSNSRSSVSQPPLAKTTERSLYPARGSSMQKGNGIHETPNSIDSVLSPIEASPLEQIPVKEVATREEENLMANTQSNYLNNGPPAPSQKMRLKPSPIGISERPLTANSELDAPGTPGSTLSRKDMVRDRKRRDIVAMKAKKQHEKAEGTSAPAAMMFAPIRVVVDVEPTDEIFLTPYQTPNSLRPVSGFVPPLELGQALVNSAQTQAVPGLPPQDFPATPTTPRYDDRISLSRRREWNNTRETRRQSGGDTEAKEAARLRAKRLLAAALAPREDESVTSQADKEILRLYEAYRDHRMREMERRVRRLERNGDVWLQALIPVLTNLNRSMMAKQGRTGTLSEDEDFAAKRQSRKREMRGRSRTQDKRSVSAAQGLSYQRLAAARKDHENLLAEFISESDDESGLSGIDPSARELADLQKRRQQRTMVVGEEGHNFF